MFAVSREVSGPLTFDGKHQDRPVKRAKGARNCERRSWSLSLLVGRMQRKRSARKQFASSPAVRRRMQATPRRDTPAEMRVRRALHAMGFRYSVDAKPLAHSRRRADIVFRRARIAVFIDGCFWHGCPQHGTWPRTNADWWRDKIVGNQKRDLDTDRELAEEGWRVFRFWEHQDPLVAARRMAAVLRRLRGY